MNYGKERDTIKSFHYGLSVFLERNLYKIIVFQFVDKANVNDCIRFKLEMKC